MPDRLTLITDAASVPEKQVTFSRFVVPFSWHKETCSKTSDSSSYWAPLSLDSGKDVSVNFTSRIKYFTPETASVLFRDALWLKLKNFRSEWARGVSVFLLGKRFRAVMHNPEMVLFEWESQTGPGGNILKTGFLIVNIELKPCPNGVQPTFDHLLSFNELFRYFDSPYPGHFRNALFPAFGHRRNSFLHDEPVHATIDDDPAHYFNAWAELLQCPLILGKNRYQVVVPKDVEDALEYLCAPSHSQRDNANRRSALLNYSDNRAYVWTAAVLKNDFKDDLDKLLPRIDEKENNNAGTRDDPTQSGYWIKLLNVDQPEHPWKVEGRQVRTHMSTTDFEKKWADARTYRRWAHFGTWYGFSYHGGVMVTRQPSSPPVVDHFKTFYFDIALLLFYLRVTLFRFSTRLYECTDRGRMVTNESEFDRIREQFAYFTIRYQFPILSNQQQAIEMYEIMREHFDVEAFYKEIKAEIHETHDFFDRRHANALARSANQLARYGIPLAVGGLVGAVISTAAIDKLKVIECWKTGQRCWTNINWEAVLLGGIVIAGTFVAWLVLKHKQRDNKRGRNE